MNHCPLDFSGWLCISWCKNQPLSQDNKMVIPDLDGSCAGGRKGFIKEMIGSFNKIRIYNRFRIKYYNNLLLGLNHLHWNTLKYLVVKDHDICTLLSNGSEKVCVKRERETERYQMIQQVGQNVNRQIWITYVWMFLVLFYFLQFFYKFKMISK